MLPRRVPRQEIPELNELQEVDAMLAETVREWTKEWESKGHQKGRQEGRQEGSSLMLTRQLQFRFGTAPGWADEKIAKADLSSLEKWSLRFVGTQSLDEVFPDKV